MPRSAHPNFLPHIKRTGISEEPAFVTLTNTDKNAGVNYSTHFKKESSGKYGKNSQPEHVFVPVPVPAQSGESTGRPNALGTWRHSLLHLSDWGGGGVAGKQLSFTSQTSRRLPSVSERASCQLHITVWIHLNAVARLQGYQPTDQLTSFRAYKREQFHRFTTEVAHHNYRSTRVNYFKGWEHSEMIFKLIFT